MAKSDGIGTTVGIKGDKAYRQALSDMGRQLRVLNTDMKASQSAFGDQATTMAGMQDKLRALSPIYEVQSQKVKLLSDKLQEMEAAGKGNSKAADNLRIDLNNATAAMNQTGIQIKATEQGLETLQAAAEASGDENAAMTMTLKEAEAALKEAEKASDGTGDAIQEEGEKAQDSEGKNSHGRKEIKTLAA